MRSSSASAIRRVLVLVALGSMGMGCDGGPRAPLSAVLITLDTTRADALGIYGGETDVSPELDALAAESVVYEAAYAVAPTTHPAHASMLTGLYPLRHRIRDNGMYPLDPSAVTLAELAREAGYDTAAFIASSVLDRSSGLEQGFVLYDVPRHPLRKSSTHSTERVATEITGAALRWLDSREEGPFFLWTHYFDPHAPYAPPRPYSERDDHYLGEIAFASAQVGRLLDALRKSGALDDAIVVVLADHGEAFGEHGEETHGMLCHEPTMRIPMLIRYPDGYRRGVRSSSFVSSVDVFPTLAEAMGLRASADLDGISLYRRRVPRDRGVYLESFTAHVTYRWSPIAGWADRSGKYLHSSEPEFYDVDEDPGETKNLFAERARDVERHRSKIEEAASLEPISRSDASIDAESLERLRALGYVALGNTPGEIPGPLDDHALPSPRRMLGVHAQNQTGLRHLSMGRFEFAQSAFEAVLTKDPDNPVAREMLALAMIRTRQCEGAIAILTGLVDEGSRSPGVYYNLGLCLRESGRPDEAITSTKRATELDRSEPIFLRELVRLLEEHAPDEAPLYEARLRELEGE